MAADEINKLNDQIAQLNRQLGKEPLKLFNIGELNEAKAVLLGLKSEIKDIVSDIGGIAVGFKNITQELTKTSVPLNDAKKSFRNLSSLAQDLKNDQEGISRLNQKQLSSLTEKIKKERENLKTTRDTLNTKKSTQGLNIQEEKALTEINGILQGNDGLYRGLLTTAIEREKVEKQINKNLGITGALLKGAENFMGKIGLGALSSAMGFDEINKELEEYAISLEEGNNTMTDAEKKQAVMGKSFELMGNAVRKALTDPMVMLKITMQAISFLAGKIADGFKRFDGTTGNIAKNLNITNSEAREVAGSMVRASFGSDKLFVSSKGLSETLTFINSTLGTSVVLSNNQLTTFTKLRETAGLTNEEMMGIFKLSLANGDSFDTNTNSLINQVNALNKSSGLYVNAKDVLKDINNLSAATTLSLGKNPKALAEAVTVAKALGMEMAKVEAIAGSLLEFESSIESELQAELLLGKDINLEKARQAALNNDLATVAEEIAKQAGSSAEFTAMNRIQQEALAKAVGMSREDLAQTLFTQEAIAGASGDEAERREKILNARIKEVGLAQAQKEAANGGLEAMLDQATATEKMEASLGKINELFNALGSIFAPIINGFATVAGFIAESKTGMIILSGVVAGLGSLLAVLGVKAAFLAVKSVITAVASIFQGSAILGPFGIPIAIAGVAALTGAIAAATKIGDMNSPADGKTQISTKEGGLFELSPNDDLIAAPGAARAMARASQPAQPVVMQNDNSESKKTNQLLEQILSKQGTIKLDSTDMGTAMSVNSYAIQ